MRRNLFIGVMTGTSVDAIDIACASFDGDSISEIISEEYSFTHELRNYIISLKSVIKLKDLSQINIRYTDEIATAIDYFIKKHKIEKSRVNAIGFHGQTLWHQPEKENFLNEKISSTYQLGSATNLATKTGIDTVGDFRTADMAVGGQGAPLIPIFDFAFLGDKETDTIVLNIGGIANITCLKANCTKNEVIAFDTGAGNCLIDLAMRKLFGKNCDFGGEIGRKGKLSQTVLESLIQEKYINKDYPKSTGKELFNEDMLNKHGVYLLSPNDVISTLTHFTVKSIAININKIVNQKFNLIIAGGGARNKLMMELLEHYLPTAKLMTPKLNGFDIADCREALLMAYLAYLRVEQRSGNLPSVTGATKEVVLGSLAIGQS